MIKFIYKKPTANTMLKCDMLKVFALIPGLSRGCLLPLIVLHLVLEVLANAYGEKKDKKSYVLIKNK